MPEVTLAAVVNLDLVKMKWKEQYVSEGLNRKVAPGQPAGIYQGLRIIENLGANLQVEISPDADTGYHMAVYQSTSGYSLTYWDLAGTATILDLSDGFLLGTDVIIGLEMDYTVGVDTVAEWKAFPLTDWNALPLARKNEIIVLGTVAVPGAGTITTAMISFERTTMAWRNISKGSITWSQIVRNGDFEQSGDGTDKSWYWELGAIPIGGSGTVLVSTADPQRNTRALEFSTLTAGSMILVAVQNVGIPVTPGQLGMFRYQKKNLVVPSAGTMNFDLVFSSAAGSNGANTLSTTIDTSVVDGGYEEVVVVFEVPAGVTVLGQIQIGGGPTYASAPIDVLRIDDVSVWLETTGERNDLQHGVSGNVVVDGRLQVSTPGAGYSGNAAQLSYDSGATKLEINDLNNSGGLTVDVNGTLTVGVDLTVDRTTILGVDQLGSISSAHVPRITAAASVFAGVEYTLMWESVPSGEKGHRLYVSPTGTAVRTVNAKWDNNTNQWTKDANGEEASRVLQTNVGSSNWYQITGTNAWADGAWVAPTVTEPGIHGDRVLMLHANSGNYVGVWGTFGRNGPDEWKADSNGDIIVFGIPLIAGDRIKSVTYSAFGGDAGNKGSQFRRSLLSTGVALTLESEPSQAVAGFYTRTWNIADILLTSDTMITYNWAGNNSGDEFYGVAITYDHPA